MTACNLFTLKVMSRLDTDAYESEGSGDRCFDIQAQEGQHHQAKVKLLSVQIWSIFAVRIS